MRGISGIVGTILLLLITIALVGIAYIYFFEVKIPNPENTEKSILSLQMVCGKNYFDDAFTVWKVCEIQNPEIPCKRVLIVKAGYGMAIDCLELRE